MTAIRGSGDARSGLLTSTPQPDMGGGRGPSRPTWALMALLGLAGGALLVILGMRLSFFNDDWYFLLQRPGLESHPGLDTLLAPHNDEIVVLLALVYKVLVAVFGMNSQLPFRLVIAITTVCLGVLVFVLVAERVGSVLGLAAAAIVLFLGPAWEALLFFASLNHLGSLTLGVGALWALQVDSPRRNATACALLVAAALTFNLGIPFVVGAAVAVALRRRPRQLWIAAVPLLLFVGWWVGYGRQQPSGVSVHSIEGLPRYIWEAASIGLTSLTGLNHGAVGSVLLRGHILLLGALLLAGAWLAWRRQASAWLLVFVVTLLVFWAFAGANAIAGRGPTASRYQITDVVLLILIGAELLRGVRLGRAVLAGASILAALIVVSNLDAMRFGYDFLRAQAGYVKVDLGALQMAGPRTPAAVDLLESSAQTQYLSGVTAGRYFAETSAHGTPPFDSPRQIAAAPAAQRHGADGVLLAAEQIRLAPDRHPVPAAGCRPLPTGASATQAPVIRLRPGTSVLVRNPSRAPLVIEMRRFAPPSLPTPIAFLAARAAGRIATADDASAVPWELAAWRPRDGAASSMSVCHA